jgi:hypothetical protein
VGEQETPTAETPTAAVVCDKAAEVYRWRREHFVELGLNRRQARRLAEIGADWHSAQTLHIRGCPLDLIFDILS